MKVGLVVFLANERESNRKRPYDTICAVRLVLSDIHTERSSENACEDPPKAATALADSLGEKAR